MEGGQQHFKTESSLSADKQPRNNFNEYDSEEDADPGGGGHDSESGDDAEEHNPDDGDFGDDFDDFEEGGQGDEDDFGDFDDGFQESGQQDSQSQQPSESMPASFAFPVAVSKDTVIQYTMIECIYCHLHSVYSPIFIRDPLYFTPSFRQMLPLVFLKPNTDSLT
jgi:DnaJ-class molecular chaperone